MAASDRKSLAAIVYAEATASSTITDEMRGVAWIVRNRKEHVNADYGKPDARWFGDGTSMKSIIEFDDQFMGAKGSRYKNFPDDPKTIAAPGDRAFAQRCYDLADQVIAAPAPEIPGRTGTFPYVWFQQGSAKPSPRASDAPKKLSNHYFWSFKDGGEQP